MTPKPTPLCKLEKGKLLDSQEGFVDTFNWMVDLLDSLTDGFNSEVVNLDVVETAEYDEETRKLTVTRRNMNAIVTDAGKPHQPENVFEAVPISEEL